MIVSYVCPDCKKYVRVEEDPNHSCYEKRKSGPYIQPRLPEYQCPVTGKMVSSRKQRREIMKEHNLVEKG